MAQVNGDPRVRFALATNLVDSMTGALCAPVSQATICVRNGEDLSA